MSILRLKDSQGNWVGVPTVKGDTGNGISSAILNSDYTLTLTFTDGTTYTTPSIRGEKGEQGDPATSMEIHICSSSEYDSGTRIPTIQNPNDKTFYLVPTEDGTSPDLFTEWVYVNNAWEMFGSASVDLSGYLTDVKVNGNSVVTDGVAEIPLAKINSIGVIKVGATTTGIKIDNDGTLKTYPAENSDVKGGARTDRPIDPAHQHMSTFYGLAKVAGHDEKDSTLPVGQYTDEAKASIKNMLGVEDVDLHYLTPEMYGAIGDGTTDDSVALQNCINDAITKELPVRGFNIYATTQPINIVAKYMNIYIHEIIYSGNDVAVILTGRYNNINIDEIDAYDSTGCGFRLTTTEEREAIYNEIHIGYIASYGNGIEYLNLYGESQGLYYNRLYINQLYSRQANCIYINANNRQCGENSFWGKHVTNNNGYFVYCENSGNNFTNRFYEFCIESSSKNGVYGQASLINCRTIECMDRKKPDNDEGNIFTFVDVLPIGKAINTYLDYLCVDVINAATYESRLELIKTRLEEGETKADSFDAGFPQDMSYVIGEGFRLWDYYSVTDSELGNNSPTGKIIAYFNHKGFVPDYDWYHKINVNEYYTITTDHVVPTIFDIDVNTTIHLDDSYCPVGINKFKVIQYDNKKVVIYDHNNNLIFNGQNYGAGTYEIECHMTNHTFDIIANSETFTYGGAATRGKYFGINEAWDVKNVISDLDADLNSKADVIIESANGDIASFEDGADMPLQSLLVDINPVQDLHGQDAPYPAGGGENKLPSIDSTQTINGVTWTLNTDGSVKLSGTASANSVYDFGRDVVTLPSGTYTTFDTTISGTYTVTVFKIVNGSASVLKSGGGGFQLTEATSVFVRYSISSGTTVNTTIHPQIKSASSPDTFSPYSNICPISGWTGVTAQRTSVNVWDEEWRNGAYALETGEFFTDENRVANKNPIPVAPSTEFYINVPYSKSNVIDVFYYDINENYIGYKTGRYERTFTTPSNCQFINFGCWGTYGSTYNSDISVNYPSTDHDYHESHAKFHTIDWQSEAGTVYGGTLDVVSGLLTVDRAMVDLGTLNWRYSEDYGSYIYTESIVPYVRKPNLYDEPTSICSVYKPLRTGYVTSLENLDYFIATTGVIYLRDVNYTDMTAFTTAVTGQTLVYELAEPITYHLTPTEVKSLLGQNNIWANTGNTSVEYRADTEKYIEKVKPDVPVDDVQINGTSIVSDGVANIPIASSGKKGIVQIQPNFGININSVGDLYINSATSEEYKNGSSMYKPTVPNNQHLSTFYGLAKAAGHDEKNSTLPVGQYTDNAKDSIQNMLGITPLIASHETDPFESNHDVIGELFIINGKLYRAKTALTAGEYVNEGTNVEIVNVAGVLNDTYVKNTDYGTSSTAGVVKVDSDWGIGMYDPAWSGGEYGNFLYISPASSDQIKSGSTGYKAIVPNIQHESVFYGLAKASGDVTQSSSLNSVGTYTEDAKSAISDMLNGAVQVSGTDPTITAKSGIRYICGEVLSLNFTPSANGICDVMFTSGSTPTVLTLPNTVKMPEWFTIEANTTYEINIADGIYGAVTSWTL